MTRHYYGYIPTQDDARTSVVVFDNADARAAWINADADNRAALTSKDARQLMTATLNDADVRRAAGYGGVELPTAAECKTIGALIAAYTAATAYCDAPNASELPDDTAIADTLAVVGRAINDAANVSHVPVEYQHMPQLSGRVLSYALIIDGYYVPFDLHIGAAAAVRAELIEVLECAADDVRERMDASDIFVGWWASLTDGRENTDDPAVITDITADVTEHTIDAITADGEFYANLLRLTAALKAAA